MSGYIWSSVPSAGYASKEPPVTSQEWWQFFAKIALNEPEFFKQMAANPSVSYFIRFGWGKSFGGQQIDQWEFELRAFLIGQAPKPAFDTSHPQATSREYTVWPSKKPRRSRR